MPGQRGCRHSPPPPPADLEAAPHSVTTAATTRTGAARLCTADHARRGLLPTQRSRPQAWTRRRLWSMPRKPKRARPHHPTHRSTLGARHARRQAAAACNTCTTRPAALDAAGSEARASSLRELRTRDARVIEKEAAIRICGRSIRPVLVDYQYSIRELSRIDRLILSAVICGELPVIPVVPI